MFKAKLIANPKFVFFRKHAQLLRLLSMLISTFIINILILDITDKSMLLILVPVYVVVFYFLYLLGKKQFKALNDRRIEMDLNLIKIINKEGLSELEIPVSSIDSINIQKEYKFIKNIREELSMTFKGVSNYHYIQIQSGGHWYTFNFLLDSLFMETKLNEILSAWITQDIAVNYSAQALSTSNIAPALETSN